MIAVGDRLSFLPLSPTQAWGGAATIYACLSLFWSSGNQPWAAAWLVSLILSFLFGTHVRFPFRVWGWVWLGLTLNFALLPWAPWGVMSNPNFLGCMFALSLASAIAYHFWFFIPIACVGLWYSHSRGAILAAGVVGVAALLPKHKLAALAVLASVIIFGYTLSFKTGNDVSVFMRVGIWNDLINHASLFGSGFGSFGTAWASFPVHTNMTLLSTNHAYNDFLELTFELGVGVVPLWVFIALCLEQASPSERLVPLAFFALSITFFPLYIFPCGQLLAFTLGHLARERNLQWHAGALPMPTI